MSLDAANNYRFKADLKRAVGQPLQYEETSMYADTNPEYKPDGKVFVVGPDAHNKRSWYASVTMADGKIAKVE